MAEAKSYTLRIHSCAPPFGITVIMRMADLEYVAEQMAMYLLTDPSKHTYILGMEDDDRVRVAITAAGRTHFVGEDGGWPRGCYTSDNALYVLHHIYGRLIAGQSKHGCVDSDAEKLHAVLGNVKRKLEEATA